MSGGISAAGARGSSTTNVVAAGSREVVRPHPARSASTIRRAVSGNERRAARNPSYQPRLRASSFSAPERDVRFLVLDAAARRGSVQAKIWRHDAEEHEMIQTLPTDRADETFDERLRVRRLRRTGSRRDVRAFQGSVEGFTELPVAITLDVANSQAIGTGLFHEGFGLPPDPSGFGMQRR